MKIFVTGNRGYIGVHLVDILKEAGHEVTGCDINLFAGCTLNKYSSPQHELIKDIRQITEFDLDGYDAVCHLAAISNDPMGELDASLTLSINRDASIRLAKIARRTGVGRFLFSGSCAVYGQAGKMDLEEDDPLSPVSVYAKSKIETETAVSKLATDGFSPVFLRNSTAYGYSPMLRIDLVANNLLATAHAYGQIRIMSDGTPWRPLVHCRDIARAFLAVLEAPTESIHNQPINVGADHENYQVCQIADQVNYLCPDATVTYTGEAGPDPRNYRVSFARLQRVLPEFSLHYTLALGLEELHAQFKKQGFDATDFECDKFVRLRTLRKRLHRLAKDKSHG